mgnify:CR=1 FL=1
MSYKHPDSVRQVAAYARHVLGGSQRAVDYWDDDHALAVGVLECSGSPSSDLMTSTTVSTHLSPNNLNGSDLRVEFIAHGPDGAEGLSNIVSSAALNVITRFLLRWR